MPNLDRLREAPTLSPMAAEAPPWLVIAHRGASGYRPEHTVASYTLAAEQGADFLEPDLVATADGVLVCRHEAEISGTTDVARHPEFAGRRATYEVDGHEVTGFFTCDFTLAELKTLRAVERLPDLRPDNTEYDGTEEIPTFVELLELREQLSERLQREIGVYPETKHPTWFADRGLPLEPALVATLEHYRLNHRTSPVFVQCFETANLQQWRDRLAVPFVQLVDTHGGPYDQVATGNDTTYADLLSPEGLTRIAAYAQAIGPHKDLVVDADGNDTGLVAAAHAAGLAVHPWTCRRENAFLPPRLRRGDDPAAAGDLRGEIESLVATGVDGLFSDFPDVAVAVRDA